jgi:4-azaleucine resistance transporter AzlC
MSPRDEFFDGVRAQLPLLLGVAPFGLAYGAYASETGLSAPLAQAMSVIIFGGASQFVAVRLIDDAVPGIVVVLTVAFVNLRHMLYSASLAPYVAQLPVRWRASLAYLLTDEAYATTITRYRAPRPRAHAHWYFLGSGIALWVSWQITTAIGVFGAAAVPESWSLDFALPLTFTAILVPSLRDRPQLAAAAVAAIVATVGFEWEYGTGLLAAIVAGMAAGMIFGRGAPPDALEA